MKTLLRHIRYTARQLVRPSACPAAHDVEHGIRRGYRHRLGNSVFDAAGSTEDWQREVYELAASEARRSGARTVFDIGCGSGRKLIQYFEDYRTVGFETGATMRHLRKEYPEREWRESDFAANIAEPADVVICADVVEHIPNPDLLMGFLARLRFSKLVLSTPERLLSYGFDHGGPPANDAHCREWTMDEFATYAGQWFTIEQHLISNRQQATQVVIAAARG